MGQIRTAECERIDRELQSLFPGGVHIECVKDTYSEDYIVWVTAADEVHPIRITTDEYEGEDWKGNVRTAIRLLTAQSGAGENA